MHQRVALEQVPDVELVAACDIDDGKRGLVKGLPFYTTCDAMLRSHPEIEAVLVSVPPKQHFEVGLRVLEEGKHLLLEKPATINLDQFEVLSHLAASKDSRFVTAFHFRCAGDVTWFADWYRREGESRLGDITGFHSMFWDPYLLSSGIVDFAARLEGSWLDSGINSLSILGAFLPSMNRVHHAEVRLKSAAPVDIHSTAVIEFRSSHGQRCTGTIETDWTHGQNWKRTRLFFADSSDSVLLNHSKHSATLISGETGVSKTLLEPSAPPDRLAAHYVGVLKDFQDHVNAGTDNVDFSRYVHTLLFQPLETADKVTCP
jgi:predicted dehydrogenase